MALLIWTAAEAAARDREAEARGIRPAWLLEAAGGAVARRLLRVRPVQIAVLVGPGKNGGDGLVAARRLATEGVRVTVYAPLGIRFADGEAWLHAAQGAGVGVVDAAGFPASVDAADWIVDAGFGTGFNRPLPDAMAEALRVVRQSGRPVLAVDVPTGIDADGGSVDPAAAPATETVTFDALKPGHVVGPAANMVGRLVVARIGLPRDAGRHYRVMDRDTIAAWLPRRARDAHKYSSGRVMVVAGSERYSGAAGLTALAAFRAGAGYVECWTHPRARDRVRWLPVVVRTLPTDDGGGLRLDEEARNRLLAADALVVGPGLGPGTARLVAELAALNRPTVVDADALMAWREAGAPRLSAAVFTPHAAEAARLLDKPTAWVEQHRVEAVRALVELTGATVLLKGPRTLIGAPGEPVAVNLAGGPELATAGTGDVLAGMIGSLLGMGRDPTAAAMTAAYWHGVAGELARAHYGPWGVTAEDVANLLGAAVDALQSGHVPEGWPEEWA